MPLILEPYYVHVHTDVHKRVSVWMGMSVCFWVTAYLCVLTGMYVNLCRRCGRVAAVGSSLWAGSSLCPVRCHPTPLQHHPHVTGACHCCHTLRIPTAFLLEHHTRAKHTLTSCQLCFPFLGFLWLTPPVRLAGVTGWPYTPRWAWQLGSLSVSSSWWPLAPPGPCACWPDSHPAACLWQWQQWNNTRVSTTSSVSAFGPPEHLPTGRKQCFAT